PSGTSDVAGAGAGKHSKTSPVWLYYREVPVVTEGGKNVRCTVSRTIPATGKAPERTVECGLALTYRRQTDSRKGSGTSGMLDHLKRKHMKAWQDVQNRSSWSATTKKKLGEIYHADGGATKTRVIDSHFARPLIQKKRHEHNRRYVIFCALESRPFNMAAGAAFRYFIGGFSPSYASQTIHPETVNKHLIELSTEVNTAITAKLRAQHDSVTKLGWCGPFVGI
ncbi:unnamed protein product, partial [Ascophyllum nodosum]